MDIVTECYNYIETHKPEKPTKKGKYWNPAEIDIALLIGIDPYTLISDIIDCNRYLIYNIYSREIYRLSTMLRCYNSMNPCVCSIARVMKRCSKIIMDYHNSTIIGVAGLRKTLSDNLKECGCYIPRLSNIIAQFQIDINRYVHSISWNMCSQLHFKYTTCDNMIFGQMLVVSELLRQDDSHDVYLSKDYIIPNTDITVFEFMFMDLNKTHLPILNYEELMVERFKTLEHIIRDRCKKLNDISKSRKRCALI